MTNTDQEKLGDSDAAGYMRYALGPLRMPPKEGRGWLFAAGELAMTASDPGQVGSVNHQPEGSEAIVVQRIRNRSAAQ